VHGTYHRRGDNGFAVMRSAVPDGNIRSRRNGLLMSGCAVLGAGFALVPVNQFPNEDRMAQQVVVLAKPRLAPLREHRSAEASAQSPARPAQAPPPAVAPFPRTAIAPAPEPVPDALEVAAILSEPPQTMSVTVALPDQQLEALPPLRKVDIAQVAEEALTSVHVPQLREPGLVAGSPPTLAAKVDAMQVGLPAPPELAGEERAAMLAEAPSEITVRIGGEAIGRVAFRTTETGSLDVQLSGLLELVADRMAPEEYTRLRNSAAASSFVPLDQLRAIGLSLRYDAIYDELEISA
jgi:hypothetical protein